MDRDCILTELTGANINLASLIMGQISSFLREYFDGAFPKHPKVYVSATPFAAAVSSISVSADVQKVKQEVILVNNRLATIKEVQQEISKKLSAVIKLYGA
uniref:Uncharacterized protein n=1 Tax=Cannabis sativa TaxID=3483 RepID=A0A803QH85_CANSA